MNNPQTANNPSIVSLFNNPNDMDNTQRVVNKFIEGLRGLGVKEEQISEIVSQYAHMIVERIMQEIVNQMNDDDIKRWNKFVATGANEAQQLLVIDKFYQKKSGGETLEDLENRVVEGIITSSVQEYNDFQTIKAKIEKLDKPTQDKVQALLDQGNFEEAQRIVGEMTK